MRSYLLASWILLLALLSGVTPAAAQPYGDDGAITQAIEAFRKAMLTKDRRQFDALCSDQMSYGHSGGRVETKTEFIDDATGARSVWKSITFSEQTYHIVGYNAIVRHVLTGETESEGKTNKVKVGVLMVWRKEADRWRLLARQAYRI